MCVYGHYTVTRIEYDANVSLFTIRFDSDTHDPPTLITRCKSRCAFNYKVGQNYCINNKTIVKCQDDNQSNDLFLTILVAIFSIIVLIMLAVVVPQIIVEKFCTVSDSAVSQHMHMQRMHMQTILKSCKSEPENECCYLFKSTNGKVYMFAMSACVSHRLYHAMV